MSSRHPQCAIHLRFNNKLFSQRHFPLTYSHILHIHIRIRLGSHSWIVYKRFLLHSDLGKVHEQEMCRNDLMTLLWLTSNLSKTCLLLFFPRIKILILQISTDANKIDRLVTTKHSLTGRFLVDRNLSLSSPLKLCFKMIGKSQPLSIHDPIKLVLRENQRNDLLFFEIVPCHFCGASEVQT